MWIKICGIRDVETARAVAGMNVDAIGLNFFDKSPRHVDERTAAQIVEALPAEVTPVGVFVNHSAEQIRRTCQSCGISTVQLHGDEPASLLAELEGLRIIRALRTDGDFASLAAEQFAAYSAGGVAPWAWLVDARVPHVYGGSGETVDWDSLDAAGRDERWPPLILAGGLTPENIARAIQTANPWGVDVAGGVESSPGVKNLTRIEEFVCRSRDAS